MRSTTITTTPATPFQLAELELQRLHPLYQLQPGRLAVFQQVPQPLLVLAELRLVSLVLLQVQHVLFQQASPRCFDFLLKGLLCDGQQNLALVNSLAKTRNESIPL